MIKQSTISKVIDFLTSVKNSGYSNIAEYCRDNNENYQSWITKINRIINNKESIPEDLYNKYETVKSLKKDIKCKDPYKSDNIDKNNLGLSEEIIDQDEIDNLDNSTKNTILRNKDGKIVGYRYNISRKNGKNVIGTLSREDMERLCNLYSSYGSNLTGKQVGTEFPNLAFADFQRIRTSFLVYKYNCPFAPHTVEENTDEELLNRSTELKANGLVRKLEKDQVKETEKAAKYILEENKKLKEQISILKENNIIDISGYPEVSPKDIIDSNKILMIHLADMHIGATLESDSLFDNSWGATELRRRLASLIRDIKYGGPYDSIIVNMLGDNLDGMDQQTARRDHRMPQNMDNRKQYKVFMEIMSWFFISLKECAKNIDIYSVPCGNHDGDFGYLATCNLRTALINKGFRFTVFDKFIGYYTVYGETYLLCHGKKLF